MGLVVDLIILGILAICVLLGYLKGLTGALLKIVSFVLALVIAFVLFKPVSNFVIQNTNWDENLEASIREIVVKEEATTDEEQDVEQGMPEVITDYINTTVENAANDAKEAIVDATARNVALTIINVATWIALFLVARIALILVKGLANILTSLPVIKQVDKLGGVIYGAIEALVIIYGLLAIVSFVSPMIQHSYLITGIQSSHIASFMYNNNLLLKIVF